VHRDLLGKFDTRTTAGRHIVFSHMLPSLWRSLPDWFRACHDPFVAPTRYSRRLI